MTKWVLALVGAVTLTASVLTHADPNVMVVSAGLVGLPAMMGGAMDRSVDRARRAAERDARIAELEKELGL